MLFLIGGDADILGPIQTIHPLTSPWVAFLLQTFYRIVKTCRQESGVNNSPVNGFDYIEDADDPAFNPYVEHWLAVYYDDNSGKIVVC